MIKMRYMLLIILMLLGINSYSQYGNFLFNQHYLEETSVTCPSVETTVATNIGITSVTLGGNVTADGGLTVTSRGIVFSTSENPLIDGVGVSRVNVGSGLGSFSANITSLTANTRYYYRSFAINSQCIAYGNQYYFDTLPQTNTPTVTTYVVSNIQDTYVTANGEIINDGGQFVYERGFVWNDTGMPNAIDDNKVVEGGTGTGSFSTTVSGFTAGNTYYLRAYGLNSNGYGYGDTTIFTTLLDTTSIYTVVTEDIINREDGLLFSGRIDGFLDLDDILEVGFYLSNDPNFLGRRSSAKYGDFISWYTIYDNFSYDTWYYVTAYIYVDGVGYITGNTVNYYEVGPFYPVIVTNDPSNVIGNSATMNGNLVYEGSQSVNQKGFVYSLTQNPDKTDNVTNNGTSEGIYSHNLTGLAYNTTYYYKAYASYTVSGFPEGTRYGEQKQFTTGESPVIPDFPTYPCGSNITVYGNYDELDSLTVTLGGSTGYVNGVFNTRITPDRVLIYIDNILVYDSGYQGSYVYTYDHSINVNPAGRNEFKEYLMGTVDPVSKKIYGSSDPPPNMEPDGYPNVLDNTQSKYTNQNVPFSFLKISNVTTAQIYVFGLREQEGYGYTDWGLFVGCPPE